MQELLVLSGNPSKRRKSRKGGKRRSAAQRRATAKMLAANRSRRGSRRSRTISANPAPKRRKYRRSMKSRVKRSMRRARGSFLKLGGGSGALSKPMSIIGPALTGAIGAITVNSVVTRLPLPAMLVTGKVRFLTQGAAAIGLGMLASNFKLLGAGTAAKMAEGALTVTLTDAIREVAQETLGVNLGGLGYYLPAVRAQAAPPQGGNAARMAGMGKYISGPGSRNVMPLTARRGMSGVRGMRGINSFAF